MSFVFLPNLTAQLVQPCEPWESGYVRPQLADKNAYRNWCNDPNTQHAFISAVEGKVPTLRVSESNPPARMSGLVLDYDAVPPGDPAMMLLNSCGDLRPAWVSRTFSGNCRVLYRFEDPVPIYGLEYGREFVKKCQRELKLRKHLPAFEQEALLDLAKYYEIGQDWTPVGNGMSRIPSTLLQAWGAWAAEKIRWDKLGPVIAMEAIRKEGQKRFPDRWPGGWEKFDVGMRGPRFWDDSATDPTAVIVRETGVQYFSDGGGFMSWEAIFGADFVRHYNDDRKGNAIKDLWFDGDTYWRKNPTGLWAPISKGDVTLDLKVAKQLSARSPAAGEPSEVDAALYDIQTLKCVKGAAPFLFKQDGPMMFNGALHLNISTLRPIEPVVDTVTDAEHWPWIESFLTSLFEPQDQLWYFLTWLKHFYLGAYSGNLKRGLALFIAGPVGAGKTMLNKALVGQLMGGSQDAGPYLLGGDKFNDPLMEVPLWTVDDEVVAGDPKQRAMFSQMVKKVVANDRVTMRAMYRSGVDMEWVGRIIVTMNDDPESLRLLPETEINILDKIMLLKVKRPVVAYWPTDAQLATELPYFAAFLRDLQPPAECLPPADNPRFGVAPYKHHDLLVSAGSTSITSSFEELLLLWRKQWFAPGGAGENDAEWVGNPTDLHAAINLNESLRSVLDRSFSSTTSIGMNLNKLIRRGVPYLASVGHRMYAISRP